MRITRNECLKIFKRNTFLLAFLLFLGTNAVLMYTSTTGGVYTKKEYRKVHETIKDMSPIEQKKYIESKYEELQRLNEVTNSSVLNFSEQENNNVNRFPELMLMKEISEELKNIEHYPNYLKEIKEKADNGSAISIFQTNDKFSQRNAIQTVKAFEGLEKNQVQLNNSKMINQIVDFGVTDILMILLILMVCLFLIVEEKDRGGFYLLKPLKHGRKQLMSAKLMVLFLATCIITIIFLTENYIISRLNYGFANLSLPIQTIAGYSGSSLHVNVGEYLLIYGISKIVVLYIVGLCFFLISLLTKSISMIYVKILMFLGISFLLYLFIPNNSMLQILKYINIIQFIRVVPIYRYYFNLNILSFPISMIMTFVCVSIFCSSILSLCNIRVFANQDSVSFYKKLSFIKRSKNKKVHNSIFYHECYKVLLTNKVIWIILLFLGFQIYSVTQKNSYVSYDEYYYKQYMQAIEGPLNAKSIELIAKEEKRFQNLDDLLEQTRQKLEKGEIKERDFVKSQEIVQSQTKGRNAFNRVLERKEYIEHYNKLHQDSIGFVYESGWDYLFGREYEPYQNDLIHATMLVIVMIIAFSGVFGMDYSTGMIKLISCNKRGRRDTVKQKWLVCGAITTIFFIITYIPDLFYVLKNYGLHSGGESIYNLPSLNGFPIAISIAGYYMMLLLIRFLIFNVILWLIFMISIFMKSTITTMLPLFFLLAAPLLIDLLGVKGIRYASFNIFLSGNCYLDIMQGNILNGIILVVPLMFAIIGAISVLKQFRE